VGIDGKAETLGVEVDGGVDVINDVAHADHGHR
jgi:hypothetical protein